MHKINYQKYYFISEYDTNLIKQQDKKTNIIFTDVDDISNGAAYFYDNKIIIWTSPLEFELRGSHRWLQNVITHEFAHIVSIQKSKNFENSFPASYFYYSHILIFHVFYALGFNPEGQS